MTAVEDPGIARLRARSQSGEAERDLAILEDLERRKGDAPAEQPNREAIEAGYAVLCAVAKNPAGAEIARAVIGTSGRSFADEAQAFVWEAMLAILDADQAPDFPTVRARVGPAVPIEVLAGIYAPPPEFAAAPENIGAHACRVLEHHRRRHVRELGGRAVALATGGDIERAIGAMTGAWLTLLEDAPTKAGTSFDMADAFDDDTPTPWICEGLQLCPGRPPMLIGYPGTGKTFAAVALLIACVYGLPVWGCPDFRPARVHLVDGERVDFFPRGLWVDFELGPRPTRKISRKILRGLGLGRAEIAAARALRGDRAPIEIERDLRLRLLDASEPAVAVFTQAWIRRVRGFDLVLIDSLRKLVPFIDDKNSLVSNALDALRAVSDATGVTFLVLHHAVKTGGPQRGGKGYQTTRPLEEMGSGSGAIDGAAGAQFVFQKEGGTEARLVSQSRPSVEADRPVLKPFYLALVNPDEGSDAVQIVYRTREQIHPPKPKKNEAAAAEQTARESAVLAFVRKNPGRSVSFILAELRKLGEAMRDTAFTALVGTMIEAGVLVNTGKTNASGSPSNAGARIFTPENAPAPAAPSSEPPARKSKK